MNYLNVVLEAIALILSVPLAAMVYKLGGKYQTFLIFFPVAIWVSLTVFGIGMTARLTSHRPPTLGTWATTGGLLAFIGMEVWVMVKIRLERARALKASRAADMQARKDRNYITTLAHPAAQLPAPRRSEGVFLANGAVRR